MTGLRLAYPGFVTGLAGAYVWATIAMLLGAAIHGDPLQRLRPLATAISGGVGPCADRARTYSPAATLRERSVVSAGSPSGSIGIEIQPLPMARTTACVRSDAESFCEIDRR